MIREKTAWDEVAPLVWSDADLTARVLRACYEGVAAFEQIQREILCAPPATPPMFQTWQTVYHARYGVGTVDRLRLCAGMWYYVVRFRDYGSRTFGRDAHFRLSAAPHPVTEPGAWKTVNPPDRLRFSNDLRVLEVGPDFRALDDPSAMPTQRPFDHTHRDSFGQFGSFPSHDDFSDEATPETTDSE